MLRKLLRKSYDEIFIIGIVGGYWGDYLKVVDSGGFVFLFKGILNIISKYREV